MTNILPLAGPLSGALALIEPELIECKGLIHAARTIAMAKAEESVSEGYDGLTQVVNLIGEQLDRIEEKLSRHQ